MQKGLKDVFKGGFRIGAALNLDYGQESSLDAIDGIGIQDYWVLVSRVVKKLKISFFSLSKPCLKLMIKKSDVTLLPYWPVLGRTDYLSLFNGNYEPKPVHDVIAI